jgi:hypothetical protein
MRPRNTFLVLFSLCLASTVAIANNPVGRAQTFVLEKQFFERGLALWGDDRYMFYMRPQAYSVDHFGILLAANMNLAPSPRPILMPFPGTGITTEEISAHKHTVLARMPKFRQFLKSELVDAASMFPGEPDTGRVSIAVTIYHFSWEDTADIPNQIVVQGVKKDLLGAKANPVVADQAIEMKDTE